MLPRGEKRGTTMALSLVTNIGSLIASNALTDNQNQLNTSISQLSTGDRIVTAATDPGGLSIATETQGLLGALNQATSNATNAQAFLETADGALSNIATQLQTAQQLATEAADGSYNSTQLGSINSQYQAILTSINQIANGASFNGISLLTGTAVTFQVGATNTANDQLSVTINKADTGTLSINTTSLTTQGNAQAALTAVTAALATIAGDRGDGGFIRAVAHGCIEQSAIDRAKPDRGAVQHPGHQRGADLCDLHQGIGVAAGGRSGPEAGRTNSVAAGGVVPVMA
jgi:flagellin